MDGWMDGWIDGWMDVYIHTHTYIYIHYRRGSVGCDDNTVGCDQDEDDARERLCRGALPWHDRHYHPYLRFLTPPPPGMYGSRGSGFRIRVQAGAPAEIQGSGGRIRI